MAVRRKKKKSADQGSGTIGSLVSAEVGPDPDAYVIGDEDGFTIPYVIPTGAATLDAAIGRGGIPAGRLTIAHGGEGGGKTTTVLSVAAEAEKMGGFCIMYDNEQKLDREWSRKIGTRSMVVVSRLSLEETLDHLFKMIEIRKGSFDAGDRSPFVIILDSLNATMAKARLEANAGDSHVAPEARLWSGNLPRIIGAARRYEITLLFVSQVRKKIGVLFGNPDQTAGGEAPRFFASLILDIRRVGSVNREGEKVGSKTLTTCKKNQIAPPFRSGAFEIDFQRGGINSEGALVAQAIRSSVLEQAGSWISRDGQNLAQGAAAMSTLLREDEALRSEIEAETRKALGWEVRDA